VTINSAKTVIANFSQITHTLTIVLKGAGSVSPSIGDHICSEGSIVSITATPGINTRFDGWTGKVADASSTSTTVTMDSDKVVTASFSDISEITHTLTLEVKGAGSVTPSVGSHSYTEGTAINITATPDTGYRFDGWTGEVGDASSASTMVTIDSDKTVVANFSKAKLTPLLLGIIIAGSVIVVGAVIWLAARRRRTRA
jgi:uncharacterized repeat protein (TIGR02543 family)